ncbi:hypothetical protein [Nocardia callitridis]|uniref:Uncharacterized protein n=1 Tax=Nocardia callitridis TaxID=648753 RepID=A0ABP9KJW1_9NOCA
MSPGWRHLCIHSGALQLHYLARADQAESVAAHLRRSSQEFVITIDDEIHDDLPALPCARLWDDCPSIQRNG